MIKIVGLIIMIAAFGLSGVMKSEELRLRIKLLEEFQNTILTLKSQMNYFREPLEILLDKLSKTGESRAFLLLNECAVEMQKKHGDIGQIWAENVNQIYKVTPLTSEDMEIIVQVGKFLGQTDFDGQQIQFECTEERLKQQICNAKEIYLQKGPLYRKIGFLMGTAAALIVL